MTSNYLDYFGLVKMDNNIIFSIVVPIYNVKQYLEGFIDCVLNQSDKDFEVILVDDGSPDNSGSICDEFAEKYDNIKVIHKTNGGVSSARNEGIKYAKGDWLLFFDPDDLFDEYAIEVLKGKLINFPSTEWIIFNFRYKYIGGKIIEERYQLPTDVIYDTVAIREHIYPEILKKGNLLRSPWTKAYRRDIIVNNGLNFSSRAFAEDYEFNLNYLKHISQVLIIDDVLYSYCLHPGTAISRYHSQAIDIWCQDTLRELKLISKSCNSFNDYLNTEYIQHKISSLAYFLASEQKYGQNFSIKLQHLFKLEVVKGLSGLSSHSIYWPLEYLRRLLLNEDINKISFWFHLFRIKIVLQNFVARIIKS